MTALWIDKLNESDSRLHKEDVLRQALELANLGEYGAGVFLGLTSATYNPFITWGIKQVPGTTGLQDRPNPWSSFNELLGKLSRRELTGGAARDAVEEISQQFDSNEWNKFCVPVLKKDLRAGISEKTVNKIVSGTKYVVPVFSCQLATSCDDRPEMRGIKRLEPKLDGVRVLMLCSTTDDGPVIVTLSRNGKVFENFTAIEESMYGLIDSISGRTGLTGFVLDGEITGRTFQELMRQARRKENVSADDSVFNIFDIVPTEEFMRGRWSKPLSYRLELLSKIKPLLSGTGNIQLLSHILVDLDTSDGRDQFERYCSDTVAAGYEGVMIKDLGAPYQCKRTTFWLKYKPVITVDLEVVDVEEGTGRNEGRLGALVCSGQDAGREIKVNVGSGFSDGDRDSLWLDRSLVIGRTVEILCDVITQNQDGTYSLRFPRFVRFRDDK
jgi:DNA ligase-1